MVYRAEIDGLRAVAVLLVFVFHLMPDLCPGGFVGVDVFFVISGFLISKIIYMKALTGEFSFIDFYHKRVLRIFPALFFMLVTCIFAAIFVFGSRDFLALMKSCRYAAAQVSNIFFAGEVDYFAEGHDSSPLLHTWSLGVEEQFYLIWPFVIYGLVQFATDLQKKLVIFILCIVSFLLSQHWLSVLPNLAFYSMPSRLWELGIGGVLGMGFLPAFKRQYINETLSLIGFLLVLGSSYYLAKLSQDMPKVKFSMIHPFDGLFYR